MQTRLLQGLTKLKSGELDLKLTLINIKRLLYAFKNRTTGWWTEWTVEINDKNEMKFVKKSGFTKKVVAKTVVAKKA